MRERGNIWARRLDYWCGIPLAYACGCLRRVARLPYLKRPHNTHPPRKERVALLCLGAIGDVLLLSALVRGLHEQCPHCHLTLITSTANAAAVPLLEGIDAHAAFNATNFMGLMGMAGFLRRGNFDILLDSSQWARAGAVISALSGAQVTVGFATPGQYRGNAYTICVPHSARIHETENFLNLGRALWPTLQGTPALAPPRSPSATASAALPAFVQDGAYIVLHMWASGLRKEIKEWPAAYWAELCQRLTDAGYAVILSGANADAPATQAFMNTYFADAKHDRLVSLAGKTRLNTLHWIVSRARAVVSVNTGVMHLAALAGAPTLGLHGATNPVRWRPVGPKTCALLPRQGAMAYLNLGFEYPHCVASSLPFLPVQDVVDVLCQWGIRAFPRSLYIDTP